MWDGDREKLELNTRPGSLVDMDRASQRASQSARLTERMQTLRDLRNNTLRNFRLRKFLKTEN
jgi:hypothetical protein